MRKIKTLYRPDFCGEKFFLKVVGNNILLSVGENLLFFHTKKSDMS